MTLREVETRLHWPKRDHAGRVARERAWVEGVMWAVALAAWVLAIASVPETLKELIP